MHHNLNQLQWQLERDSCRGHNSKTCHGHDSKKCLVVLRTQFKKFFDSKQVNALDFQNKCWQKNFINGLKWEPVNYRRLLLQYLEELDKLIDERVLKYGALRMKEKEVQAIQERRLQDSEMQKQESLITEGATIEACLVIEGVALEACLVNEGIIVNDNTGVTERNDVDHNIGSSYDSDTVTKAPHSSNDTFQNVFAHGIQSHEQLESIPDTYKVNENNSNIISDIPNMNPDRNKEEHDDVDYEQQRSFFPSLINNLKCDVEKCNEVNREA
ncbi:hypothetical protein Tco_1185558 [Tanacetum coccineum]